MTKKTRKKAFQACIFTVVCILISAVFIIRSGHIMGGDYALYICQAENLLSGTQQKVYQDMQEMLKLSTYSYYSPALYPWGLPLLLTIPVVIFGVNYIAFKIFLFLCIILSILLLAQSYIKRGEEEGFWVVLLVGFNVNLLFSTERVLTSIPFLLFLTLSLIIIHQHHPFRKYNKKCILQALGLGLVLFITSQIRTEGFLLFPALFLHQIKEFFLSKDRKGCFFIQAVIPYITVLVLIVLTLPCFPSGFLGHSNHFRGFSIHLLLENLSYYLLDGPSLCLSLFQGTSPWLGGCFWFIIICGIISVKSKYIADLTFLFANILLLSIWPYQDIRYFIPLMPTILYLFVKGLYNLFKVHKLMHINISGILLGCCFCTQLFFLVLFLLNYDKTYNDQKMNVESLNATAMFNYLRTHTRSGDVVGCAESRTIYLYTGLISCNLSASPDDTAYKADWYVEFRNRGGYLQHEPYILETNPELFREVFRNHDFIIYKIQKP